MSTNDIPPPGIEDIPSSHENGYKVKDLTDLPNDLFLLITSYLSPQDSVLCRRVSRSWLSAFTNENVSWTLMRWHFPRSREMRQATAESDDEKKKKKKKQPNWARLFAKVARRYYYLRAAKPRLTEKIDCVHEGGALFRAVTPWTRWLRWNESTAVFQHRDPTWCFDDGLLVYQEAVSTQWVAYDLETRHRFPVPFDSLEKTVRRVRLTCGVLVVEWCEREAYHQLNAQEKVYRHFATAFDVQRSRSSTTSTSDVQSTSTTTIWHITFRSEWKIHFLGFPLNNYDRFFSAHTSTHYAIYIWQPNRSPWGEEDPLEQLIIWDISNPSPYRPSLDPAGMHKPDEEGPTVINRFTWRDLGFLGLRQRHTPSFREILLDDRNVYVHEEEHRWLAGQHSSLSPPRHHLVRCTGIPFVGMGPRWRDECCADGDVHMSFCPRAGSLSRILGSEALFTPAWPGWAPCWRHEEFPYLTVGDVVDASAGVRVVARQCFMMEALSSFVVPKISVLQQSGRSVGGGSRDGALGEGQGSGDHEDDDDGDDDRAKDRDSDEGEDGDEEEVSEVRFADEMWWELLGKGKIAGDERWVVGEDGDGKITIIRF
ncbi:hypothetical protein M426DRAFT_323438 [Hypoxylon sp. CI-4A]|nr:hypothetical protein M426DRAFT_323438 [Hypoxylon sp. CI-4A]